MVRTDFTDRLKLLTLGSALAVLLIVAGCAYIWYGFFYDEGVRLGRQIASEATRLRASNEGERVFTFRPLLGTDQRYSIEIASSPQCRATPCDPPVGLTVAVERGHGGFTAYHRRFVSVPVHLEVKKSQAAAQILLRKNGKDVQVVELR